jgi:hypothetical protein
MTAGSRKWYPSSAVSPDGRTLADVTAWRRELCALAGRNLTLQEWHEFLPGRLYQRTSSTTS